MRSPIFAFLFMLVVTVSPSKPGEPQAPEPQAELEGGGVQDKAERCDAPVEDWTGLLQLSKDMASGGTTNALSTADAAADQQPPARPTATATPEIWGWPTPVNTTGGDHWCRGEIPPANWNVTTPCSSGNVSQQVRVMSYNLYWWNLFLKRNGNGRSAGKLMEAAHKEQPLDFLGLQEADDVMRALRDANLDKSHRVVRGPYHISIAYLASEWELLAEGKVDVGEDENIVGQYFGKRAALWGRFRSRSTGKAVFFINHHGPLRVGKGGRCGGAAVAYNLLKVIGRNARRGDFVVMVGDFNACRRTPTMRTLQRFMVNHITGGTHGGVDHILSSCSEALVSTKNHGTGGSDHDAISASFRI